MGLLAGIEKVSDMLEGMLRPETEKGVIRSKILVSWERLRWAPTCFGYLLIRTRDQRWVKVRI